MKNKNLIFLVIILILFVIISVFFIKVILFKDTLSYKSIEITPGENAYTYGSNIYTYGRNGLKIYENENLLLDDKFSIQNPIAITSLDKIAIGDKNGKTIRVYSDISHMYTLNLADTVLGFNINKNGYCGVILKLGETYQIDVFDEKGAQIYSIKDIPITEGVPISVSISQDNKAIAISYLKINEAIVSSNIIIHSIEANQVFGGFIKENQIVSSLNFAENNNLVAGSDIEIFILKINTSLNSLSAKEIYKKEFENNIEYIKFLDNDNFAIFYGSPISNSENIVEKNTIAFYSSTGSKSGEYTFETGISDIFVNDFGAIVSNGRLFTGISKNGKKLWEYQATQDINSMLFYTSKNKIIVIGNNDIKITDIHKNIYDSQLDEIENTSITNNTEEEIESSKTEEGVTKQEPSADYTTKEE